GVQTCALPICLTKQEEAFQANREQRQHDLHAYRISLAEQEERIKNEREKHAVLQKQLHELNDQYHALEKEFADLIEMRKNGETEANMVYSYKKNRSFVICMV